MFHLKGLTLRVLFFSVFFVGVLQTNKTQALNKAGARAYFEKLEISRHYYIDVTKDEFITTIQRRRPNMNGKDDKTDNDVKKLQKIIDQTYDTLMKMLHAVGQRDEFVKPKALVMTSGKPNASVRTARICFKGDVRREDKLTTVGQEVGEENIIRFSVGATGVGYNIIATERQLPCHVRPLGEHNKEQVLFHLKKACPGAKYENNILVIPKVCDKYDKMSRHDTIQIRLMMNFIVADPTLIDGITISHELSHYFLLHAFFPVNQYFYDITENLVERSFIPTVVADNTALFAEWTKIARREYPSEMHGITASHELKNESFIAFYEKLARRGLGHISKEEQADLLGAEIYFNFGGKIEDYIPYANKLIELVFTVKYNLRTKEVGDRKTSCIRKMTANFPNMTSIGTILDKHHDPCYRVMRIMQNYPTYYGSVR